MNTIQKNLHAVNTVSDVEAGSSRDARRLSAILETYLAQFERGQCPDRSALLRDYPELADQLRECLDSLDLIQGAASELCGAADGEEQSLPLALGDFRILREIGRGGMGVVYEAEQLSLGRRVALKVLPFAAMLDRQQFARFKNEARAAATLDHSNIVAIYSVGDERGVHYYAMQLIEGQSLAQVVEQLRNKKQVGAASRAALPDNIDSTRSDPDRLAVPTAADTAPVAHLQTLRATGSDLPVYSSPEYFRTIARLGIQAAEALDHAHQNGILHRDIKPANLLVDDAGKLWITDFGLARIEQDAGMTMTGDILGTLRYMSPEQALAKRVVVDHRSDLYSLGVTLYELITLQPAFTGEDRQELLHQIALQDPCSIRLINNQIPNDLETILHKSIEKDPADRYPTARALANDLQRFLDHRSILARPTTRIQRARKWIRRHPAVLWSAVAVLLVATAFSLAGTMLLANAYSSEADARHSAEIAQAKADRDRLRAELALGRLQFETGVNLLNQGSETGLLHLLDALSTSQSDAQQRDAVIRLWTIAHARHHHKLTHVFDAADAGPAYSPDGKLIAAANGTTTHVWSSSTGQAYGRPVTSGEGTSWTEFNATGSRLATLSNSGARLWDAKTWAPVGPFFTHDKTEDPNGEMTTFPQAAALSSDGTLLATIGSDGTARIWKTKTGEASGQPIKCSAAILSSVVFTPDGKHLAVGTGRGRTDENGMVTIWDIETGQLQGNPFSAPKVENDRIRPTIRKLAFTPDGKSLAVMGWYSVWLLDSSTGHLQQTFESKSTGDHHDFSLSPDGKLLAVASNWNVQLWDVTTGAPRGEPLHHGGRVISVAFSYDGVLLATGSDDRTVHLWRVATGTPIAHTVHSGKVSSVAFSPDNKVIAAGSDDIRLWELSDATIPEQESPPSYMFDELFVSPDGRTTATITTNEEVEISDAAQTTKQAKRIGQLARHAAFSPNSKLLAIGTAGWTAEIWDVSTVRKLQVFPCNERVYGVAFDATGGRLVTAQFNGTAKIWNVLTGHPQGLPMKHPNPVVEVAFSPDGNLLATAFGDDRSALEVKIWEVSMEPPYLGVLLPFRVPANVGAFDEFSLTGQIRIGTNEVGDRVVWTLPNKPAGIDEIRLQTAKSLGLRHDLSSIPTAIPMSEWHEIKSEVELLQQHRDTAEKDVRPGN